MQRRARGGAVGLNLPRHGDALARARVRVQRAMAPPDDAACARFCDRSVMCSAVSIAVGSPISNLFRAGGFWLCQGSWGRMSAPHLDGPREATSGCVGLRRASSVPSGSTGQTCLSPPRWTCWASMGSFGLRRVPVGPAGQCGAFRPLSGSVGPRGAVWSVSDLVGIRRVPVGVRAGLRRAPSGSVGPRAAQSCLTRQSAAYADAGALADVQSWSEPAGLAPACAGAPQATVMRAAAIRAERPRNLEETEGLGTLAGRGASGSEVSSEVLREVF